MRIPTKEETIAKAQQQIAELQKAIASGKLTPEEIEDAREAIGSIGLSAVIADNIE